MIDTAFSPAQRRADRTRQVADWRDHYDGPVVLVRTFATDPGYLDAFMLVFQRELTRLKGRIPGWRGSRLHRSLDGNGAVTYATFDTQADYVAWRASAQYRVLMEIVSPFIAGCSECLYAPPGDGVYPLPGLEDDAPRPRRPDEAA